MTTKRPPRRFVLEPVLLAAAACGAALAAVGTSGEPQVAQAQGIQAPGRVGVPKSAPRPAEPPIEGRSAPPPLAAARPPWPWEARGELYPGVEVEAAPPEAAAPERADETPEQSQSSSSAGRSRSR